VVELGPNSAEKETCEIKLPRITASQATFLGTDSTARSLKCPTGDACLSLRAGY